MIEKIKAWCKNRQLLHKGDKIVIACSGGPDSLALTDILLKLKDEYDLTLAVAHLDHMIRGEASKADAAFVRAFCQERGILYVEKSADVPAYAKRHSLSLEDAARTVRYQFLHEVAEKLGHAKIATGHHQDDQAETVFLHLLRGAGSAGISGIRPSNCGIIRPLLSVSRAEVEHYCQTEKLKPRLDATNLIPDYTRNKIRLNLLPQLSREYNPALREALCRTAELIGAEHAFIRDYSEQCFEACSCREAKQIVFQRKALNCLHLAVKREVFRIAVAQMRGHLKEITFFHIEQMIKFAVCGKVGAVLELPGRLVLKCDYETLRLFYLEKSALAKQHFVSALLDVPGITAVTDLGLTIKAESVDVYQRPNGKNQIICDMNRLQFPLSVRVRQDGDRFQPSGMQGSKKLKDFFIDHKIERDMRDKILLFCDQNEIFWVGGLRQNQSSMVSDNTRNFLILTIIESGGK